MLAGIEREMDRKKCQVFLIGDTEIEINSNQIKSSVGFVGVGKTGIPREKPLRAEKTSNKLNPHDPESGNRTQARLVEGKCPHHCTTIALQKKVSALVFFTQFNYTDTKRKKKMLGTFRLVYSEHKGSFTEMNFLLEINVTSKSKNT